MIRLISPENGSSVSVMTGFQKKFVRLFNEGALDGKKFPPDGKGAYDWLPPRKLTGRDMAAPAFVIFRWECEDPALALFFEISERRDFSSPAAVSVSAIREDGACEGMFFLTVTNLCGSAQYFWRIRYGESYSETFSFTTEPADVRFLWIEGISNVRDLGGRVNLDGARIKQGMLYRGPAIETIIDPPYEMTARGKRAFTEELGIKTEIDLREEAREIIRSCPLSDDIKYCQIPFECYEEAFCDDNARSLRQIFTVLSDGSNYPVYFHCQIGSDRTGTLSMIILAALGSSDRDIDFDYSVNSVTVWEKRSFTGSPYVAEFLKELDEKYPGGTVGEKLIRHLLAVGVTEEQIARVREILLEEATV